MRKLEDVEHDIDKVQSLLRTLYLERHLILTVLEGLETSSQILAEQAIEKMKK